MHWNPGAKMPLMLPVHLICNTSDEEIFENIRINSHNHGDWLRLEKEHGKTALLCGSGPSLSDKLEEIRWSQIKGGVVFALNGAAAYLQSRGITPDYQVIIDARAETAQLVGPAKEHLFASQVHPACFIRQPNARIWHLEVAGIDGLLPQYDRSYCLIGGAASVGNTATCLAFAMGYRRMRCFGYDSCHKDGAGHAFPQPMNDGDPIASVRFNGKDYIASLTMKLQAEKFMDTARTLKAYGCNITVEGSGLLPDMFNAPRDEMAEDEKYRRMWERPEYRKLSPGESLVDKFIEIAQPSGTVIDLGCGTGRAGVRLRDHGIPVVLIDFTDNSRDPDALSLPFLQCDITEHIPLSMPYGFCTDVMEHIPTDRIDAALTNIIKAAERIFFQISTEPDDFGRLIDEPLHLTVRPHAWWREKLLSHGLEIEWEEETPISALFYVRRTQKEPI